MEDIVFFNQWTRRPQTAPQVFTLPTCTVPDQTMTIKEIIAKFTRTGLVPQSYLRQDLGGQVADEPGFDPMDEFNEAMETAAREKAAAGDSDAAPAVSGEPDDLPSAPAGAGGE